MDDTVLFKRGGEICILVNNKENLTKEEIEDTIEKLEDLRSLKIDQTHNNTCVTYEIKLLFALLQKETDPLVKEKIYNKALILSFGTSDLEQIEKELSEIPYQQDQNQGGFFSKYLKSPFGIIKNYQLNYQDRVLEATAEILSVSDNQKHQEICIKALDTIECLDKDHPKQVASFILKQVAQIKARVQPPGQIGNQEARPLAGGSNRHII